MIEANAFFAMFAVLVLTISAMHMFFLTRFVRLKTATMPDEYFAQIDPTMNRHESMEQFITRYCIAHAAVALLGVLLLVWLFGYMQRPDWDRRYVVFPVMAYFMLQWLPMAFTALMGIKHMRALKHFMLHAKRKATLRRRGLFDFVSPITVLTAVLAYLLIVAFLLFAQPVTLASALFIGAATFDCALSAFMVYRTLYGKKSDPFETSAGRLYTIGMRVRSSIYSSIAVILFMSFTVAAILLDMVRWMPFALAAFLTVVTLITFRVFMAPPRELLPGEFDSSEVPS